MFYATMAHGVLKGSGMKADVFSKAAVALAKLQGRNGTTKELSGDRRGKNLNSGLLMSAMAVMRRVEGLSSEGKEAVSNVWAKVGNLVDRADDSDGMTIWSDAGAKAASAPKVTAAVVRGMGALGRALKKPSPMEPEAAVGAAEFLMSSRWVGDVSEAYWWLSGIKALTSLKDAAPVAVWMSSNSVGGGDALELNVQDLFGAPKEGDVKVHVVSMHPIGKGSAVAISNQEMSSKGPGVFSLPLAAAKLEPGEYRINLKVSGDVKLSEFSRDVVVTGALEPVEFSVVISALSDTVGKGAKKTVAYPQALKEGGAAVSLATQRLTAGVKLNSASTGKPWKGLSQVFLHLTHVESGLEASFAGKYDGPTKEYVFVLTTASAKDRLHGKSGVFKAQVVAGDVAASKPLAWDVGSLTIKFPEGSETAESSAGLEPLPVIEHLFREPESRPPAIISLVFAGATIGVPWIALMAGLRIAGANLRNMPLGAGFLPAVAFQVGVGAICFMYLLFWLRVNMFTTLNYVIVLAIGTMIAGWMTLSNINGARTSSEKKKAD